MTATILSIIGGIITLAIMIFKWRMDKSNAKKEAQDAEDKKIDAVANADDVLLELDRLYQPPANRP